MADPNDDKLLQGEIVNTQGDTLDPKEKTKLDEADKLRETVGNVYTFVRSQELNRVIAAFTFDHYIDEAKRRLKGTGRQIVDAAGKVVMDDKGTAAPPRPSLLDYLAKLQEAFTSSYPVALKAAKNADTDPTKTTSKTGA